MPTIICVIIGRTEVDYQIIKHVVDGTAYYKNVTAIVFMCSMSDTVFTRGNEIYVTEVQAKLYLTALNAGFHGDWLYHGTTEITIHEAPESNESLLKVSYTSKILV